MDKGRGSAGYADAWEEWYIQEVIEQTVTSFCMLYFIGWVLKSRSKMVDSG